MIAAGDKVYRRIDRPLSLPERLDSRPDETPETLAPATDAQIDRYVGPLETKGENNHPIVGRALALLIGGDEYPSDHFSEFKAANGAVYYVKRGENGKLIIAGNIYDLANLVKALCDGSSQINNSIGPWYTSRFVGMIRYESWLDLSPFRFKFNVIDKDRQLYQVEIGQAGKTGCMWSECNLFSVSRRDFDGLIAFLSRPYNRFFEEPISLDHSFEDALEILRSVVTNESVQGGERIAEKIKVKEIQWFWRSTVVYKSIERDSYMKNVGVMINPSGQIVSIIFTFDEGKLDPYEDHDIPQNWHGVNVAEFVGTHSDDANTIAWKVSNTNPIDSKRDTFDRILPTLKEAFPAVNHVLDSTDGTTSSGSLQSGTPPTLPFIPPTPTPAPAGGTAPPSGSSAAPKSATSKAKLAAAVAAADESWKSPTGRAQMWNSAAVYTNSSALEASVF